MSTTKHILVVEDEALIALDMETTLRDLGHRVTTAATTAVAESVLAANEIDLAVLDYHLKDGTCDKLARSLRQKGIPFVICSGTAGLSELGQAFQGALFLAKPFTSDALVGALLGAQGIQA